MVPAAIDADEGNPRKAQKTRRIRSTGEAFDEARLNEIEIAHLRGWHFLSRRIMRHLPLGGLPRLVVAGPNIRVRHDIIMYVGARSLLLMMTVMNASAVITVMMAVMHWRSPQ
jgi:hypothetical protein